EPQPLEIPQRQVGELPAATARVEVFQAQAQLATSAAHVQPREQERASVTQMQLPRRARCEPPSGQDRLSHASIQAPSLPTLHFGSVAPAPRTRSSRRTYARAAPSPCSTGKPACTQPGK